MITVPEGFGWALPDEARAWIHTLPALATKFCSRWRLTPEGDVLTGYCAVVIPVRQQDGHPAVLKLTWLDEWTKDEPLALRLYDGDGAVQLLDHDAELGALLLERLDHGYTLGDAPIEEAIAVSGGLLRRHRIPAPEGLRRARVDIPSGKVPQRYVDAAQEYGAALSAAGDTLVNADLHYYNVLRGHREPWLLIDPQPLSGDPEYALISLLWNRFGEMDGRRGLLDRIAALVDIGELDAGRARRWAFVRAVENWADEDVRPPDPAVHSEQIARWLFDHGAGGLR